MPIPEETADTNSEKKGNTIPEERVNSFISTSKEYTFPEKKPNMSLSTLVLPPQLVEGFYET